MVFVLQNDIVFWTKLHFVRMFTGRADCMLTIWWLRHVFLLREAKCKQKKFRTEYTYNYLILQALNDFWTNSSSLSQCSSLVGLTACPQFSGYVTFFCLEKPKEVRYAIYRHTHAKTHTWFESMFRHSNDLLRGTVRRVRILESDRDLNFKLGIQIKTCFRISYQNHQMCYQRFIEKSMFCPKNRDVVLYKLSGHSIFILQSLKTSKMKRCLSSTKQKLAGLKIC